MNVEKKEIKKVVRHPVNNEIDLVALMFYLKRYILWMIIVALTGSMLMICYVHKFITPQYQSTTSIFVYGMDTTIANLRNNINISSEMSEDYVYISTTHEITEKVISELDLDMEPKELASHVSVSNPANTKILKITTTYPDPELAAKISDAVGDVMRARIADITDTNKPSVVSTAEVSNRPISPNVKKYAMMGGLAGMLLVAGMATLLFLLDDSLKTEDDIKNELSLLVLATLPSDYNLKKKNESADRERRRRRWIHRVRMKKHDKE